MTEEIMIIQEYSKITPDEFWRLLNDIETEQKLSTTTPERRRQLDEEWITAVYYRCATDILSFAAIFFPHYCKYDFNAFHTDAFESYQYGERNVRRGDAAPRGFAKSTIKVLFKPIHDICYKLEKFIVVISNTEQQTIQKLRDIQSELIGNDLLIYVYGRFIQGRKVGSTDFIAHNGDHKCRFLALGSGTEMRGIRFGDVRPTKILLDDVEHSEEVENEMLREKLVNWYADVISKIGDGETNIEIVGTILHQQSLLKGILNNPRYKTKSYKAIISWADNRELWDKWTEIYVNLDNDNRLEDAREFYLKNETEMLKGVEVLWPDKEPYYKLQEEIIESGMRSFMKEKQNDPQSDVEKIFAPESIWWYEEQQHGLFIERTNTLIPWQALTAYGAIDPATGQTKATQKKKSDFACILSGYVDSKKRLFVHHDFLKRVAPSVFIKEIFELHKRFEYYKFGVETNLFRNLLMDNIKTERSRIEKENGSLIKIKFYDIDLVENKEKRIYTLEPKVQHGHILFNKKAISTEFMNQLYDFPKGIHDDGPDTLEMLYGLVNNKYAVGGINKDIER
jgi:predicted phage terminase large subunit-like protein